MNVSSHDTIRPEDLKNMTCICGNTTFVSVQKFKIVSPLITGLPAAAQLPYPVLVCHKCAEEPEEMKSRTTDIINRHLQQFVTQLRAQAQELRNKEQSHPGPRLVK